METLKVRPSPIAGYWYPGNPRTLQQQVSVYLQEAEIPSIEGEVIAVIAPHAGYQYSGKTAGYAFRCVQGYSPEIVAVASPFHEYHPMPLLTSAYQAYETPLGVIEIDREAVDALNQHLGEQLGEDLEFIVQEREHAVEIELPFLQCTLGEGFKLLPLMISTEDAKLITKLGEGLAEVLRDRPALLVASTDLSHFYSHTEAKALDTEMLNQIAAFSPEGVLEVQRSGKGAACGVMAVVAVMVAARALGADTAKVVHYSTSAEVSGDKSSVVGYGAVVLLRSG